ncbi:MAG TPA: hypothetical protein PKD61_17870 [Polyangiaceae bacterium]|nr:hypothetical protein [Polyangiaceae bacterium]
MAARNDVGSKRRAIVARSRPSALANDDSIERTVAEIRHLTRKAALDLALEIGEIVFRRIFDGDMKSVRKHGPKHASFRQLALHPELPMSATGLWRSVTMFELWLRLPQLKNCKHISANHIHAVLALPPRDQERLLKRAERQKWRASELWAQAAARRKGAGGRPPKLEIVKALDQLRRVAVVPLSTFSDRSVIRRMGEEEVEVALVTLDEIEQRLAALRAALREAAGP